MLMLDADHINSRRLFHIAGPETGNARSPNLLQVRDIKQLVLLAERKD
jgi:hypothetical protein